MTAIEDLLQNTVKTLRVEQEKREQKMLSDIARREKIMLMVLEKRESEQSKSHQQVLDQLQALSERLNQLEKRINAISSNCR